MLYYICINKIHTNVRAFNDLYVEIKYNNVIKKTKTVWNKEYPTWNEDFVFNLKQNLNYFTITIYEKNVVFSTQKIYENNIQLNNDKIKKFKYKYLEISHGIPLYETIENLKNENIKLSNKNLNLNNKYINLKNEYTNYKKKIINTINNLENNETSLKNKI